MLITQDRLRNGTAQAILVNAGNANACNGPRGLETARATCRAAAKLLNIPERLVLPSSTGVIGAPLPGDRITQALPQLVAGLNPDGLGEAARAIMTTDTRPKASLVKGIIDGQEFTLAGIAKGSGMIHPDMATLLVFLFTDAAATPKVLKTLLRQALTKSFNRITVDGDTSTNDTILLLAGGRAGNAVINEPGPAMTALGEAVTQVMGELAHQVVADGEGARHVYRVEVTGAATAGGGQKGRPDRGPLAPGQDRHGRAKTSTGGGSWPPWDAPGPASTPSGWISPSAPHPVVQNGRGLGPKAEAAAQQVIKSGAFTVTIHLN